MLEVCFIVEVKSFEDYQVQSINVMMMPKNVYHRVRQQGIFYGVWRKHELYGGIAKDICGVIKYEYKR